MSLVNKNWHENVMAALEIVRDAVGEADEQIRVAGGKEMAQGDKKTARLALKYSDTLEAFMFELEKVGDRWQEIRDMIDADNPEVREVVLPTRVRETKDGYKRKVREMAPWTNFTVRFAGAELIEEPTAKATFARALGHFDMDKVAKLGVMLNGEPLVSQDRKTFAKYPQSVVEVVAGWYASTSCSTATKARFISEFAKKFGIKAEVAIVPHK